MIILGLFFVYFSSNTLIRINHNTWSWKENIKFGTKSLEILLTWIAKGDYVGIKVFKMLEVLRHVNCATMLNKLKYNFTYPRENS